MVLIHSLNGKQFCTVTVWIGLEGRCFHFNLAFEVMGQDLLLNSGHLFLMPLFTKRGKNENLVLAVFDIDTGQEKANYTWDKGRRRPPLVYKESGEKRLYAYENKLLQILPSETWTILFFAFQHQKGD